MIVALILSTFLVLITIFLHYEALRLLSNLIPKIDIPVRAKVLVVVLGCFAAHTVEIWLYAIAYMLIEINGLGALQGKLDDQFSDLLYFSVTSYSTLGIGDVYPTGALRLVSGVEAVNGLFLIAWSTSFAYFVMERLWPLHNRDGK